MIVPSPLQYLASHAIAFAAGAATTFALRLYGRYMRACGAKQRAAVGD